MSENLKSRTMKGALWSALQKFGVMGLSFIANMILARTLSPGDFGCIAMLAIFLVVSDTFMDGGLGAALIQKKKLSRADCSCVFLFNIGVAALLYLILFVSAPWIAEFYKLPLLNPVLKMEGLVLFINAFGVVQTSLLRKEMLFKKLAAANLSASIVSAVSAVVLAFCGFGVWSLVWQQIILSTVRVAMLWFQSSWRPVFLFSGSSFNGLFGFGSFIFLSNLVNNICNNVQGLIIGRAFNASTLGYYSQAKNLEQVASTSFSAIIDQVSYPAMAIRQDDKESMRRIVKKFVKIISFVTIPLMGFLALLGRPIIEFCYGSHWLQSVPYFQVLCLAGIAISLQGVNYYAVAAVGKTKALFGWTLVKRIGGIVLILVGLIWGMPGLLAGVVAGSYLILIVNAIQVQIYIGYKVLRQMGSILYIGMGTLAGLCCAFGASRMFDLNSTLTYLLESAVFIAAVSIFYALTCRKLSAEVVDVAKSVIKRRK